MVVDWNRMVHGYLGLVISVHIVLKLPHLERLATRSNLELV